MDAIMIGFLLGVVIAFILFIISTWNSYHIKKGSKAHLLLEKEGYKPAYKFWFK